MIKDLDYSKAMRAFIESVNVCIKKNIEDSSYLLLGESIHSKDSIPSLVTYSLKVYTITEGHKKGSEVGIYTETCSKKDLERCKERAFNVLTEYIIKLIK